MLFFPKKLPLAIFMEKITIFAYFFFIKCQVFGNFLTFIGQFYGGSGSYQGCQICPPIGADWHQMAQIWDFQDQFSVHLGSPKKGKNELHISPPSPQIVVHHTQQLDQHPESYQRSGGHVQRPGGCSQQSDDWSPARHVAESLVPVTQTSRQLHQRLPGQVEVPAGQSGRPGISVWAQSGSNWQQVGHQISVHFATSTQNVLKSDLKKSQICGI